MPATWEDPDELVIGLPGVAVTALNLDSRNHWPGLRVMEWKKAGRGFVCMISAKPLAWRALLESVKGGQAIRSAAEIKAVERAMRLVKDGLAS